MVMGAARRSMRRLWPRRAVFVGLPALALLPAVAEAHAVLVRAVPPARSVVRVPPRRAQLWFSEQLEPAYSTLSVWSDQKKIDAGNPAVSDGDARVISVDLPPLDRGVYVVRYRVLSVDGHVAEGTYSFTVKGEAARK